LQHAQTLIVMWGRGDQSTQAAEIAAQKPTEPLVVVYRDQKTTASAFYFKSTV
jgi:hypothetical protein